MKDWNRAMWLAEKLVTAIQAWDNEYALRISGFDDAFWPDAILGWSETYRGEAAAQGRRA